MSPERVLRAAGLLLLGLLVPALARPDMQPGPKERVCRVPVNTVHLDCANTGFSGLLYQTPSPAADGVHVAVVCDPTSAIQRRHGSRTVTVAWLVEPADISPAPYAFALTSAEDFYLTFSLDLHKRRPSNTIFMPSLEHWVRREDWGMHSESKTRMVAMILSEKASTEGHRLRHRIRERIVADEHLKSMVDMFGRGAAHPIAAKYPEATKAYRYAIVVENSRQDYYVSEKAIDHMLTGAVVIYWGSRIDKVLRGVDTDAIITVDSEDDVIRTLRDVVSVADFERRRSAVEKNLGILRDFFDIQEPGNSARIDWEIARTAVNRLVSPDGRLYPCIA